MLSADDRTLQSAQVREQTSTDGPSLDEEQGLCEEACSLCEQCKQDTRNLPTGLPHRKVVFLLISATLLASTLLLGGAVFLGHPVRHSSSKEATSSSREADVAVDDAVVNVPALAPETTSTTALLSTTETTTEAEQRPVASDVEPAASGAEREPGVCSVEMPIEQVTPREAWQLPAHVQRSCFKNVIQRYKWNDEDQIAQQNESNGRNWCWVGVKEFGCHASLYAAQRPHLSWEEMRYKAVPVAPQPEPDNTYRPLLNHSVCDKADFGAKQVWSESDWHAAWLWFSKHVTVYAINLKTNVERWESFETRLKSLHLTPRRVWGVDMREKDALAKAKAEGLVPPSYNFSQAQREASRTYQYMGGILGTVGCASAHFRAQTTAYKESQTPLALVFEDDAHPADDFVPKLWSLVHKELPCDWQVVALRSMCPFGTCVARHLTRVQPDVNEPEDRCRHGVNYGMQGVLYRVGEIPHIQAKWQRTVFNESRPHCLDVDVALASLSDTIGFYAVPFVQYPGFLTERRGFSSRFTINES